MEARASQPLIAGALLFVLLLAGAASAHHSATSRVHNMRHIALEQFGDACDVGTMKVPIVRRRLPRIKYPGEKKRRQVLARFSWARALNGRPWTGCLVEINDQHWETEQLCDLVGHELGGHGTGWRAPPGTAFVNADGSIDVYHSADPANVMYPFGPTPWAPCAHGAADIAGTGEGAGGPSSSVMGARAAAPLETTGGCAALASAATHPRNGAQPERSSANTVSSATAGNARCATRSRANLTVPCATFGRLASTATEGDPHA